MKNLHPLINYLIYALVIALSVIALLLAFNVPPRLLNLRSVYQGF
jgi:hypothetical protein